MVVVGSIDLMEAPRPPIHPQVRPSTGDPVRGSLCIWGRRAHATPHGGRRLPSASPARFNHQPRASVNNNNRRTDHVLTSRKRDGEARAQEAGLHPVVVRWDRGGGGGGNGQSFVRRTWMAACPRPQGICGGRGAIAVDSLTHLSLRGGMSKPVGPPAWGPDPTQAATQTQTQPQIRSGPSVGSVNSGCSFFSWLECLSNFGFGTIDNRVFYDRAPSSLTPPLYLTPNNTVSCLLYKPPS